MNFFKRVLSSLVALAIFFGLGIVLFLIVISALSAEEPVIVEDNSVLRLKLNKPISEVEFDNPFDGLGALGSSSSTIGLVQLKQAIASAKEDDKIQGIYLDMPRLIAGMGVIEEIRNELIDFKSSGKFIVAYGENYSESSFYLSTVADQVYLNPEGDIEFNGLDMDVTFLKGMMEKLEIEPQIFRVGDFKSAVEPYIRKDMSDENRLQLTSLLNSIYDNMLHNIATSRNIELKELTEISDKMLARNPQEALRLRLIDDLYYEDQVYTSLRDKLGINSDDNIEFISYGDYKQTVSSYQRSDNEVAIIVASGEIVSGKGEMTTIGSKKFAAEIRKARKDDDIKAVVLRINSPGGSFIASDVMWREIELTAKEKPIIASMSDVAASGGYYMAMACDTIVAQPNTITGSIGIFSMLFNVEGFMENKLGITTDEVKTGEYSSLYTMSRPLTNQEKRIIQKETNAGYETFTSKAAQGRNMNIDDLKAIASGRVWTGTQALENGLVDMLGGLDDAISVATEKANISDDYKIRYYPEQKSVFEQIVDDLSGDVKVEATKEQLGDLYPYLIQYQKIKDLQGRQARLLFDIEFH